MRDVVLDEGPYVRALQAECSDDPGDLRCAALVHAIQSRHRWVFSHDVVVAYRRQFSVLNCKGALSSGLMISLDQTLFGQSSFVWIADPVDVAGGYDKDDRHVVCAAASVPGSLLVTVDLRLVEALTLTGLAARNGFSVADPELATCLLA